ncbi:MAG: CDP-glucose 4,6-dehydratase [Verrucomicrobia bacterium 12-59-8]|nr:MAG: CDP-glucose 4,6-dehydratase [Verrucomicrobia bacterium 12-59-8]
MVMFAGTFNDKRVFLTGHTGFKGSWMSLWLHMLGARVFGYSLPPRPGTDLRADLPANIWQREWAADIRDEGLLSSAIAEASPDIVIHMAAQPLVRLSYAQPLETFSVNAWGTAMLLDIVRRSRCAASVLVVSSDKCYHNTNSGTPFCENDPLGGSDVYSMSKAATEMVAAAWHKSFFALDDALGAMATARAGNVIGGGDYAADRIIPDSVRAHVAGETLVMRNPSATRPWQHVLECLSGYLSLAQRLLTHPKDKTLLSLNFGPDPESERTVGEVIEAFHAVWPGSWEVRADPNAVPEATRLTLNHQRSVEVLGWRPVWNFATTITRTAEWYQKRHAGSEVNLAELSRAQIMGYAEDASTHGLSWAVED